MEICVGYTAEEPVLTIKHTAKIYIDNTPIYTMYYFAFLLLIFCITLPAKTCSELIF